MSHENLRKYFTYILYYNNYKDKFYVGINGSHFSIEGIDDGISLLNIFGDSIYLYEKNKKSNCFNLNINLPSFSNVEIDLFLHIYPPDFDLEHKNSLSEKSERVFNEFLDYYWSAFEDYFDPLMEREIFVNDVNRKIKRKHFVELAKEKDSLKQGEKLELVRILANALRKLPGTESMKVELLTSEQYFDNKCCGLYSHQKRTAYIQAVDWCSGRILELSDMLDTLAHESAHGQGLESVNEQDSQKHNLDFKVLEERNKYLLRQMLADELFEGTIYSSQKNILNTPRVLTQRIHYTKKQVTKKKKPFFWPF